MGSLGIRDGSCWWSFPKNVRLFNSQKLSGFHLNQPTLTQTKPPPCVSKAKQPADPHLLQFGHHGRIQSPLQGGLQPAPKASHIHQHLMVLHRQLLRLLSVGMQCRCLQFSVQTQNEGSFQFTLWYFLFQRFQQYFTQVCWPNQSVTSAQPSQPSLVFLGGRLRNCFVEVSVHSACIYTCCLIGALHDGSPQWLALVGDGLKPLVARDEMPLFHHVVIEACAGTKKHKTQSHTRFNNSALGGGGGRLYVSGSQLAGC